MLRSLTVEQIGIIDRAHVEFGPGFTAVTGETGAGKSLFIDAIGLALGGRADSDLVRSGAARAVVTLVAEVADARVAMALREAGIEPSDAFTVRRELSADGRSSVRVDGRPVSVGTLRAIGARLTRPCWPRSGRPSFSTNGSGQRPLSRRLRFRPRTRLGSRPDAPYRPRDRASASASSGWTSCGSRWARSPRPG
jgi:hypothetical protein